jgi:DASH complex subunit Dad2
VVKSFGVKLHVVLARRVPLSKINKPDPWQGNGGAANQRPAHVTGLALNSAHASNWNIFNVYAPANAVPFCRIATLNRLSLATMSLPNRGALASHVRSTSIAGTASTGQSSILQARINEKKAELAHLKELQALSAGLADQMEKLENKLATLSDGTEGLFPLCLSRILQDFEAPSFDERRGTAG